MPETTNVDYSTKIPNNVGLMDDQRVLKALEQWHPGYIDWWMARGPEGFQTSEVYLRTAISIDPKGWAKFDYVKMPEYRWGILLAPRQEDRQVNFGAHKGEKAWQEVPGEYRAMLRRLIVIQGDTEPASVEQQHHLGKSAPSLYDMRNLFQVNVEEGRHLWAMVYLLQKYFGKDGREEAEELLVRQSGDADKPRMLGAFNEATPDWLSFFMFTFFTDRDGKMQLESLAQSGFDPLSRTCRFMLTEEAHHMFVGETGVGRAIERTCQAMKEAGVEDPNDIAAVQEARRHRSADHAEEGQPALHAVAGPVRLGGLDQCGELLQLRRQGPLPGDPDRGRPSADQRHLPREQAGRRQGQDGGRAGAHRHQHAPARRLRHRLRQGRRALEQGDRKGRRRISGSSCRTWPSIATSASSPTSRRRPQARPSARRSGRSGRTNGSPPRRTAISSRA